MQCAHVVHVRCAHEVYVRCAHVMHVLCVSVVHVWYARAMCSAANVSDMPSRVELSGVVWDCGPRGLGS